MAEDRSKSTQELDLERRLGQPTKSPRPTSVQPVSTSPVAPYATDETDLTGYVGVSQEYQTYADDTHKPIAASEDSIAGRQEKMLLDAIATSQTEGVVASATEASNEGQTDNSPEGGHKRLDTPDADLGDAGAGSGEVIDNKDNSGKEIAEPEFPVPPSARS